MCEIYAKDQLKCIQMTLAMSVCMSVNACDVSHFSATFFPFHALCVDGTDLSFLSYFGFSGAKAGQSLCGSGPMCFVK